MNLEELPKGKLQLQRAASVHVMYGLPGFPAADAIPDLSSPAVRAAQQALWKMLLAQCEKQREICLEDIRTKIFSALKKGASEAEKVNTNLAKIMKQVALSWKTGDPRFADDFFRDMVFRKGLGTEGLYDPSDLLSAAPTGLRIAAENRFIVCVGTEGVKVPVRELVDIVLRKRKESYVVELALKGSWTMRCRDQEIGWIRIVLHTKAYEHTGCYVKLIHEEGRGRVYRWTEDMKPIRAPKGTAVVGVIWGMGSRCEGAGWLLVKES